MNQLKENPAACQPQPVVSGEDGFGRIIKVGPVCPDAKNGKQ
jgi:hypothetical protein